MNYFKKIKYKDCQLPLILIYDFRLDDDNTLTLILQNDDDAEVRNFQKVREYFHVWLDKHKYDERDIIIKMECDGDRKYYLLDKLKWDPHYGDVNEENYYLANMFYGNITDVTKSFDRMRKINAVMKTK